MAFYGTVSAVIEDSGINPDDLGFKDNDNLTKDEKLTAKIQSWLTIATNYIDQDRKKTFSFQNTPPCIANIAERIAVNMAKQAKINRALNLIDTDDFKVVVAEDTIFTQSIEDDLKRCAPLITEDNCPGFSILTIYDPEKMDEDE